MYSKITRFAVGAAVALSLFGGAGMAQAASLSAAQVSAIIGLLQSFGADQSTINNVQVALGGSNSTDSLSCGSFGDVSYGQFDNNPGGRVSQLQTWLGIPSSSFGFGTYGNKTKAAWNAKCGGAQPTSQSQTVSGTFKYSSMSGLGSFQLTSGSVSGLTTITILGSDALQLLGIDTQASIGDTCNWAVDATVVIKDVSSSLDSGGTAFTVTKVISKGSPRQVCPMQTSGTPTATIDQSSLTINTTKDTAIVAIAGTAANTGAVRISMGGLGNTSLAKIYDSGNLAVVNGRWSVNATPVLSTGMYTIYVYDANNYPTVLTTGTLTVTSGQASATAPSISVTGTARPYVTFAFANLPTSDIQGIYLVNATTGTNVTSMGTGGGTGTGSLLVPDAVPAGRYFLRALAQVNNRTIVESALFDVGALTLTPTATIDPSSIGTGSIGYRTGYPVIIGTATNVSSVQVTITDSNGHRWYNAPVLVSSNGAWILKPNGDSNNSSSSPLADGTYTITVSGPNSGASVTNSFTINVANAAVGGTAFSDVQKSIIAAVDNQRQILKSGNATAIRAILIGRSSADSQLVSQLTSATDSQILDAGGAYLMAIPDDQKLLSGQWSINGNKATVTFVHSASGDPISGEFTKINGQWY